MKQYMQNFSGVSHLDRKCWTLVFSIDGNYTWLLHIANKMCVVMRNLRIHKFGVIDAKGLIMHREVLVHI